MTNITNRPTTTPTTTGIKTDEPENATGKENEI